MKIIVVDEFQASDQYKILGLSQDIPMKQYTHYKINGTIYEPVYLHIRPRIGTKPIRNHIAICSKRTESFLDAEVEFENFEKLLLCEE